VTKNNAARFIIPEFAKKSQQKIDRAGKRAFLIATTVLTVESFLPVF